MNQDDFLEAENKLHIATDKAYQKHLKKMEALTERQVIAQEQIVKAMALILPPKLNKSKATEGAKL